MSPADGGGMKSRSGGGRAGGDPAALTTFSRFRSTRCLGGTMGVAILEAVEGDRERDVQAVQTRLIEESILSTPARDQALLTASTYRTGVITIPQGFIILKAPFYRRPMQLSVVSASRMQNAR